MLTTWLIKFFKMLSGIMYNIIILVFRTDMYVFKCHCVTLFKFENRFFFVR